MRQITKGGPIGYYRLDINQKPVGLTINIKYNFLPEKQLFNQ